MLALRCVALQPEIDGRVAGAGRFDGQANADEIG